jgi:hypothetical protein
MSKASNKIKDSISSFGSGTSLSINLLNKYMSSQSPDPHDFVNKDNSISKIQINQTVKSFSLNKKSKRFLRDLKQNLE